MTDPVIDRLLAHPKDFRTVLRRYRNAVFHFQQSVLDARIIDLLQHGPPHVYWVRALHDELVRFCALTADGTSRCSAPPLNLAFGVHAMLNHE